MTKSPIELFWTAKNNDALSLSLHFTIFHHDTGNFFVTKQQQEEKSHVLGVGCLSLCCYCPLIITTAIAQLWIIGCIYPNKKVKHLGVRLVLILCLTETEWSPKRGEMCLTDTVCETHFSFSQFRAQLFFCQGYKYWLATKRQYLEDYVGTVWILSWWCVRKERWKEGYFWKFGEAMFAKQNNIKKK